jgi:predicted MFS family arabinose efflux permease
MMPLDLFRNRTFAGANLLTVLLYAAMSAVMFVLPLLLVGAHQYSATAAGATFLPFSVIMGAGSRWSGKLATRIGPRSQLMLGQAIVAAACVVLGLSGHRSSYWSGFLPGLIALATGMTLCVPPLTTKVFDSSPQKHSGAASGINNAAARAGGLLAIAALGLAFGGSGVGDAGPSTLTGAYQSVMWGAAVLSSLGAATAALAIHGRPAR